LYALLKAYNRPGGVVVSAYNGIVVPEAIHYAGYYSVFADIDYMSLNMTAETLKQAMSSDVTVILATHVFGIPCEIEEIISVSRQRGVLVVENAAPAIGAEFRGRVVGRFGDAAIISFLGKKVISGGAGGALLTNDDELAQKVSRLQLATMPSGNCLTSFAKALATKLATNSWIYPATLFGHRMLDGEPMFQLVAPNTEMPARYLRPCARFSSALVLMQLDRLEWNLRRRRTLAQIYQDKLAQHPALTLPIIPENSSPAWIQFPVLVNDKRSFYKHMQRNGVDLSWTYRYYCADSYGLDGFPNTQKAAKTLLGLPTYPALSDEQARYICDVADTYSNGA
jgi:dTDP-4-amino-4,6-dideoxygalactose transaminase